MPLWASLTALALVVAVFALSICSAHVPGLREWTGAAPLDREVDTAGKDTRSGESTPPADTCGRCRKPFDPTDTTFDGQARQGVTPFCRRCVDRCHESEDAGHRCPVCSPLGGDAR